MNPCTRTSPTSRRGSPFRFLLLPALLLLPLLTAPLNAQEGEIWWDATDPRIGLRAGILDAGSAIWNMEHLSFTPRPDGFYNPENPGDSRFSNTDLAFSGNRVIVGNYNGFQVYDVSTPSRPQLVLSVVCPGGQGDVSIFGDLVFYSAQETRGRIDCGTEGAPDPVDPERLRGLRIFDISDLANPRQVAAVQTCRGSHTHTLVTDPNDDANIYVYISGTSLARPGEEMSGCVPINDPTEPGTSYFSIAVVQVPLAAPERSRVIREPRIFADPESGEIAALWPGGDHGPGTQTSRQTNQCHDITTYPELGLAAGACSGNGILLDISDPANPVRIDAVVDENFAYWHSATFNNDGTTVIFTDEWGGGSQPRCRESDLPTWGANAHFRLEDGKLHHVGYYKLPVPQTDSENCVAHNGSLVPVPGRDIKVQAWYQGGVSVFDFTDPANPFEIAFFDRGPMSETERWTGGYWSTYWYNGYIYGSEIGRGLDVFRLTAGEHLTQNEIDASNLVVFEEFNPQMQPRKRWPPAFVVSRAYLDQLERSQGLSASELEGVRGRLAELEQMSAGSARADGLYALADRIEGRASASSDEARVRALAHSVRRLVALD